MVGRSSVINSSHQPAAMRLSEFLSDLALMEDDSKKLLKLDNFIRSLEDELKRIVDSQHHVPCTVLFLSEAITNLKEMKMACKVQVTSKEQAPFKSVPDEHAIMEDIPVLDDDKKDWLSSAALWNGDTHFNNLQVIHLESDDDEEEVNNASHNQFDSFQAHQNGNGGTFHQNLDKKRSDSSIHGGISQSLGQMVNSVPIRFDPRENCVRNIHRPSSSFMIGQEPLMKKRKMWSVELQVKFLKAIETLGGPLAATPKKILDCMQVADLTEDEIKSHLLNFRLIHGCEASGHSPLPPSENMHSGFRQDKLKMSKHLIQPGPQKTPLHLGGPSTGQMAAAANIANDDPTAVSKARGRLSLPPFNNTHSGLTLDVLKNEIFIQSGSVQTPLHTGESSKRRVVATANKANGDWKPK